MANLNEQHTLYRIVSLRNPEKSKKENQNIRFVLHPTNNGIFFESIENRTESQTKWQAIVQTATSFPALTSEREIENIDSDFYKVADWLSRNRQTAKAEEIDKKIEGLSGLDSSNEIKLWDNLFYAVITDKNGYIKENILQMLVLQNLLKQSKTTTSKAERLKLLSPLANASVVLPTEIFEEDEIVAPSNLEKKAKPIEFYSQSLQKAEQIGTAKFNIQELEIAKKELAKIEKKQKLAVQKNYEAAQNKYQATIKPLLDTYKVDYKAAKLALEVDAHTNKEVVNLNLLDVPYPELPKFEFDFPKEIDEAVLKSKLSKNSVGNLNEIVDWEIVENYDEIYQIIDNQINIENKKVIEQFSFSNQFASFGDMVFSVAKENPSERIEFSVCNYELPKVGCYSISLNITVPNSSLSVTSISYHPKLQDESVVANSTNFTQANYPVAGNVVTIVLFGQNGFIENQINPLTGLVADIQFSNGTIYTFDVNFSLTRIYSCAKGILTVKNQSNQDDFTPKGFGFRQLGIADYKKVVTEICGYRAGEVAHIENVMAGETREKVTSKTHKSEVTDFESTEIETEKLSDTTSTERFEMQTEIAKMLQEQKANEGHANIHASYGTATLDAGASFATNTSKEESNKQAVTQAKEQTQRAMERIVSRIKNEKTVKVTDEFIETNKHRFENLTNPFNVSGVYRFINAVYKNQIYNYGKRLMYEFMVPQPSKLHRLGLKVCLSNENAIKLEKPIDPRSLGFTNFETIDENSYKTLLAKYDVKDAKPFPADEIILAKSFEYAVSTGGNQTINKQGAIKIPKDYYSKSAQIIYTAHTGNDSGNYNTILILVGNNLQTVLANNEQEDIDKLFKNINPYIDEVPVSITISTFYSANITVSIKCQLTPEAIENWKKETYEAIIKGYEEQLRVFEQKQAELKAQGTQFLDSNPLFYRQTEQLILRKNCISYLIDNNNLTTARKFGLPMYNTANTTFENHQVTISQKMDDYTSFAKFMEQAFEWNLMSYNFYPFYWGNNDEWDDLYKFETNDPTYRAFMQAGMARVVVTVKPGFENAVMHYMAFGQIWNGGQMPVLGNPLYLSIVDELKEQEYTVEDVWQTVVPTNLVALQSSGVAIAGGGLPCADECKDHQDVSIVVNDKTVGNLTIPVIKANELINN